MSTQKILWTNINDIVCCTCEYWGGEREMNFISNQTRLLAQSMPQAKCSAMNVLSSFSNPGARYCKYYKRWHKLP